MLDELVRDAEPDDAARVQPRRVGRLQHRRAESTFQCPLLDRHQRCGLDALDAAACRRRNGEGRGFGVRRHLHHRDDVVFAEGEERLLEGAAEFLDDGT